MTNIEEFLFDWKRGIMGVFRIRPEEIHGYSNKKDFEDLVIKPHMLKLGIDESDLELSNSIKYPGDY